ncbi:hypothetical protein [Afipia felis]|uniref:hypothetical protein n=1 Tax=Afipia felis TaxID=1035 RepID=UPI0012E16916|nr:hypothetical protein [Afipia felis]
MNWNTVFFRSDFEPRFLVRLLIFRRSRTPRRYFKKLVYKKNGNIRPAFRPWVTRTPLHGLPVLDGAVVQHPHVEFLNRLLPLPEQVEAWKRSIAPTQVLAKEEVLRLLRPALHGWLILSVSHDNYTKVPGGVQICLLREERMARDAGGHYLNIHPAQPLPCLAPESDNGDTPVVLILDGNVLGSCSISDLVGAIGDMTRLDTKVSLIIHQLLGHNPEQIAQLGKYIDSKDIVVWLHDYFMICPSVRLQRNDLAFCGAPDVASNACGICVYGEERVHHLRRMKKFFATLAPTVISPSTFTQDLWVSRTSFRTTKILTVPHVSLAWEKRHDTLESNKAPRIRLAFLGTPARYKGWFVFDRLSRDPRFQDKFDFVVFTTSKIRSEARKVDVQISHEMTDAMARAIKAEQIDLVLHWPEWPETFALTAYEALEGGAWLITNESSGNVASTVERLKRGIILTDEDALTAFLSSDASHQMAEMARAERAAFTVTAAKSRLSLSVLGGGK